MNMMVLKQYTKNTEVGKILKMSKTKITPEKIEEVKQAISEYEYRTNRMHNLNGTSVEVRNLIIRGKNAVADIILIFKDRKEPYNDMEYDIEKLGVEVE